MSGREIRGVRDKLLTVGTKKYAADIEFLLIVTNVAVEFFLNIPKWRRVDGWQNVV